MIKQALAIVYKDFQIEFGRKKLSTSLIGDFLDYFWNFERELGGNVEY